MSFLQPILLLGLPLVALPLVIHLVHQYRHRSVPWAAMMFLVRARRMNQGMAKLRYWLIMLMRMLAVLGLILALSRPLSTGWWSGLGAAKAEVTVVLLDRSASMELRDIQTGESKRSTALVKLAGSLEERAGEAELVLIDSATREARRVESVRALPDLPFAAATAAAADIPGLLETALGYLEANDAGSADVWICSDLAEADWDAGSGRWAVMREQLASRKGVRVFLLSYPGLGVGNLAVRVSSAWLERRGDRAELVLDVAVA
ncbi:MAG: BatA domain-containing protein, partial [Limisphaerales bacterium]